MVSEDKGKRIVNNSSRFLHKKICYRTNIGSGVAMVIVQKTESQAKDAGSVTLYHMACALSM